MRVKICGVLTVGQAKRIANLGADAIGLLAGIDTKKEGVARRTITREVAREIVSSLPPFIDSVLITTYESIGRIIKTCRFVGNKTVQMYWTEGFDGNKIKRIRGALPYMKIINAVHVTDRSAIKKAKTMENFSDAILLDSKVGNRLGGTGKTHDWSISSRIVQNSKIPIILAGGLNPKNLREAIEKVGPWGVDVITGVENPDGSKNYEKIEKFIRIAKRSDKERRPTTNY